MRTIQIAPLPNKNSRIQPRIHCEIAQTADRLASHDNIFKRNKTRVLLGTTATLAAAAVAVGFASGAFATKGHGNPDVRATRPGVSAPAVPGSEAPSATKTIEASPTYTESPDSVLDGAPFAALTPEQKAEVTSLHSMSLEEFLTTVPESEQTAYGDLIVETYWPYALKQLENHTLNRQAYQDAGPQNINTPAQGVLDEFNDKLAAISWSLTTGGSPDAIQDNRREDAVKALASVFGNVDGYTGDPSFYKAWADRLTNEQSLEDPETDGVAYAESDGYGENYASLTSPETPLDANSQKEINGIGDLYDTTLTVRYESVKQMDGTTAGQWVEVYEEPTGQNDQFNPYRAPVTGQ